MFFVVLYQYLVDTFGLYSWYHSRCVCYNEVLGRFSESKSILMKTSEYKSMLVEI